MGCNKITRTNVRSEFPTPKQGKCTYQNVLGNSIEGTAKQLVDQ
jgi:hypothetical protein